MELSSFPYDSQDCAFTVGKWSRSNTDLLPRPTSSFPGTIAAADHQWLPIDMALFVQNTEMVLVSADVSFQQAYYSCCSEPFPTFIYTLRMERNSLAYTTSIVLPLILVTLLGLFALRLNPSSGERIGTQMTTILTIVAISFVTSDLTPKPVAGESAFALGGEHAP